MRAFWRFGSVLSRPELISASGALRAAGPGGLRLVRRHRWGARRAVFVAAPPFASRAAPMRTRKSLRFDRKLRVVAERAILCGRFSGQLVFCWAVRPGRRGRAGGPQKVRLVHSRDLAMPFFTIFTQCVPH